MRTILHAALLLLALLGAPAANATHDECAGPEDVLDLAGRAYVAMDGGGVFGYITGPTVTPWWWTYVESNGRPGLQRGGASLFGEEDPCGDSGDPDTLVF